MDRRNFVGLAGFALLGGIGMSTAEDRLALNAAALDHLVDTAPYQPPLEAMHVATGIAGELEDLLRERLSAGQSTRVGAALANVNLVRADLSHKLDRPTDARSLARRARLQATTAGNDELEGLALRVAAIIEYREGNAGRALTFARSGRRLVAYGPVGAGLAAEEARALALNPSTPPAAVDAAVTDALRIAEHLPPSDLGLGRLGLTYNPIEAHYVGALSHLRLGRRAAAREHLAEARPTFDGVGLRHFSTGLRVEEAHALLRPGDRDVEAACALARESMEIFGTWRTRGVTDRLGAFARDLGPLRGSPVARDTRAEIVHWLGAPVQV